MKNGWENLALDHSSWRSAVHNGKRDFKKNIVAHEKLKRDIHKVLNVHFCENVAAKCHLTYNECGCICLSRACLKNYQMQHSLIRLMHISTCRGCKKNVLKLVN